MVAKQSVCLFLTCEHGGNSVPAKWRSAFKSLESQQHLGSHRGYDPGALFAAERLAELLSAPLVHSAVTRLLVDLNRSVESADLFSKFTSVLDEDQRQQIITDFYQPYRDEVTATIKDKVAAGDSVIHLSVHTFTPMFRGTKRDFDVGVLYDPSRNWESQLSHRMAGSLNEENIHAVLNRPYLGTDDGFTTALRRDFENSRYAGIEIEVSNRFAKFASRTKLKWCEKLAAAIRAAAE